MGVPTPAVDSKSVKRIGSLSDVVATLHHRQVENIKARSDDRLKIILKQTARKTVRADDDDLAVSRRAASQEGSDCGSCLRFAVRRDRVLKVERERVGGGRGGLGEEFRT